MKWTWTLALLLTAISACASKNDGARVDTGPGRASGPGDDSGLEEGALDPFEGSWRRTPPIDELDEDGEVTLRWEVELRFDSASSLTVEMRSEVGTIAVGVFYEAADGELITKKTGWCPEEEGGGLYRTQLVDDELLIERVDDPCETQSELLAATWARP